MRARCPPDQMGLLHALGEANQALADPAGDIRGLEVRDRAGNRIGKVDELLIDDREKRVRLLRVDSGGLLGPDDAWFLIPAESIIRITTERVYVNRSGEYVAAGPSYAPGMADQRYLESVYAHYGYYPYWTPGYVYPSYGARSSR